MALWSKQSSTWEDGVEFALPPAGRGELRRKGI
jgi:hypothetical protein